MNFNKRKYMTKNFLRLPIFTILELLIVIAIIAILASLFFPALVKVKEKGKQVGCLSNLKQVGIGALQYANDFNEIIPPNGNPTWLYNTYKCDSWDTFLLDGSYVNEKICYCSSAPPYKYTQNYTYGWSGRSQVSMRYFIKITKLDAPSRPTNYILCGDSSYTGYPTYRQFYFFLYAAVGTPSTSSDSCLFLRHQKKTNTVFADGHAAAMSRKELESNPHTWYDVYKNKTCSIMVRGSEDF